MATKPQTPTTGRASSAARNDASTETNEAAQQGDAPKVATKQRIATQKIILHRDGQRITVKSGQKFAFTVEELKGLKESVREPVNESQTAEEVVFEPVVPLQQVAQPAANNSGDPEEL